MLVPAGLGFYAEVCACTLARAHGRSGVPVAMASYLGACDRFDRANECKPPLARTGGEAFDEDNAKQRADLAWQEEVRFLWGERYMDVSNAQRVRYECSRSSTNESWIGKAGERIAGDAAVKKRCRITALPCRGERDKADKRDR